MRITNNPTVLFGPSSELRQVFVLLHFFYSRKGLFPPHDGWPRLCFFFPWCSAKCYQRHDKTEPLLENQKKKKKLHTLDNPVRKASCLCHWGPLLKLNYLLSVVITALSINIQGSSYWDKWVEPKLLGQATGDILVATFSPEENWLHFWPWRSYSILYRTELRF